MEKFKLSKKGICIASKTQKDHVFPIDSDTCSLCAAVWNRSCCACPLDEVNGCNCDDERGPWTKWRLTGNPEAMISDLKKALALVKSARVRVDTSSS